MLTKDTLENITSFLLKVHLLILIAPIIDFTISGSSPDSMGYVSLKGADILTYYFKLMLPGGVPGVTIGMHIASYLLFALMAIFIYQKTKKILRVLIGGIIGYTIFFINAILPSVLVFFQILFKNALLLPSQIYTLMLQKSWLANTSLLLGDADLQTIQSHDILMARIFWFFIVIQLGTIVYLLDKNTWHILKNTLRPSRIFNFILLALIGMVLGDKLSQGSGLLDIVNIISLIVFILLIILNSMLAVFINDAEDIKIDIISNPSRPLAQNIISLPSWKKIRNIIIILIALGTLTLSAATALFLILTQGIYFIYSKYPLKLKRHFISSSVAMGLATIFITLAGFYFVYPDAGVFAFPIKALLIIGFSQALLSNMKDIKDFTGDGSENIQTLPVVFGIKKSKIIIALLYAIVFISIPIFLQFYQLLPFALFCSLFAYYLFTKKIYCEGHIFFLLFIYMGMLFITLLS